MYHEKQSKALCAVHALNNLFQDKDAFTKKDLDDICLTLSPNSTWLNPHRSMLGIGDYDVNVVIAALQTKDCDAIWFDKRKSIEDIDASRVFGFILNSPSNMRVGLVQLPIRRKHWIAIRKIDQEYYNLDSKNKHPEKVGSEMSLKAFLQKHLSTGECELLIIIDKSVNKEAVWCCRDNGTGDNG